MKPDSVPMTQSAASLLLLVALHAPLHAAEKVFPLKISENRRHLVSQKGTPFIYQADTPWMLFTKLTESDAKDYIAHLEDQGFSAFPGIAHPERTRRELRRRAPLGVQLRAGSSLRAN